MSPHPILSDLYQFYQHDGRKMGKGVEDGLLSSLSVELVWVARAP